MVRIGSHATKLLVINGKIFQLFCQFIILVISNISGEEIKKYYKNDAARQSKTVNL